MLLVPARLCCRDSGDVLAVGDVTGRIVFWHGIREAVDAVESGAEPALPQATVHWHAEPVCCLEFSPDGTYMLSGMLGRAMLAGWMVWFHGQLH